MKKIMVLVALVLVFQVTPLFAQDDGMNGKSGRFSMHDVNNDGQISQDEFMEHAKKKFSEKDSNADGMISKEEATKSWEGKRAEMKEKREEMRRKWEEGHRGDSSAMPVPMPAPVENAVEGAMEPALGTMPAIGQATDEEPIGFEIPE